jgi:hypothetical protein
MQIDFFQQIKSRLHLFLLKKLSTCKEIAPVLSQSMDRHLTIFERIRLTVHMIVCKWCRDYLFQIRLIRELAVTAERSFEEFGEPLSEAATLKLKQRLSLAREPGTKGSRS